MKVSIIGTGAMASGLASALAPAGHELFIGARDPAKAAALAARVGHGASGSDIAAAARRGDVVILALPYAAMAAAIEQAEGLAGKVLVDISNPITPDFKGLVLGHTSSAAEEVQKRAPRARVVKAFNTLFATLLPAEGRQGRALQVFIAGDDADARAQVAELARSAGLEPVESGPLSNSRFIEPIGEMNIHFAFFLGRGRAVAPAWVSV